MAVCDFSTIIKIILAHKREGAKDPDDNRHEYTQVSLIKGLFDSFYMSKDNYEFDEDVISRWITGKRPVNSEIVNFYRNAENKNELSESFTCNVFPYLFDFDSVVEQIYSIVRNDRENLSQQMRDKLTEGYPFSDDDEKIGFVSDVIFTALDGTGVIGKFNQNIVAVNTIYGTDVPAPCKYFCGRDNEITEIHTALESSSKLFISGVAGIGKSETAKAYAKKYKKHYRNIFYFIFEDNLKKLVIEMNHSDDKISDDNAALFKRHIAFLKFLDDNSLLIIDNFNITSTDDNFLNEIMKLKCKIIFTSRSSFDIGDTFSLPEIKDIEILVDLAGKFFEYTNDNKIIVTELIEAVHHHTLSVEMVAKLLHSGKHSPEILLRHLKANSADPVSKDKIKIIKDGINTKDIYYNHIRTLFSLYLLEKNYQAIMRCMVFVPTKGISIRRLAELMKLPDTNGINDLIELGFIANTENDSVCLHPMIKDITLLDLKPSITNCSEFMKSIDYLFLIQGIELSDYQVIISIMENTVRYADKDDKSAYLLMLENFYGFVSNYNKYDNMLTSVNEMKLLLDDPTVGDNNDRALLYNNRAMYARETGENLAKAVSNQHKALSLCDPEKNTVLFANINMNLGLLYFEKGEKGRGLDFMEKAFISIKLSQAYNNDLFVIACNFTACLCSEKFYTKALNVLNECALITENLMPRYHAGFIYETANVYVYKREFPKAFNLYNKAFKEYIDNGLLNELAHQKVRAANLLKQCGVDYPREWETDYLSYPELRL